MDSNRTYDELLEEWNNTIIHFLIVEDVFLCAYLLFGSIGNILVIYAYAFKMKGKTDNRYFIPYLAVFDLLGCIIGTSFALARNFRHVMFRGDALCKSIWFFGTLMNGCSGLLLAVISVQRYLKICRPVGFQMTLKWKRIALFAVVIVSIGSSIPTCFFYGEVEIPNTMFNITGHTCDKRTRENRTFAISYSVFVIAMAVMCTVCLIVFYTLIGKTIYKHNKKLQKYGSKGLTSIPKLEQSDSVDLDKESTTINISYINHTSASSIRQNQQFETKLNGDSQKPYNSKNSETLQDVLRRYKYSFMFLCITAVFIVAYAPWNILNLLETLDPDFWSKLSDKQITVYLFLYRLYLLNSVVNPFIYGFFDTTFRKVIKNLICRCCLKREN